MKRLNIVVLICFISLLVVAQETPKTFKNPILPGFHPDPSICRVENDYYMVTSSFEWFPGVPVYHSTDLVNWEHIGNVLDRPEQLNLEEGHRHNGGIWAPTIRFHKGLFYMITTVAGRGNFYVTAKNPAGPWSNPIWLKAPGIDPSLFWDDDGRCWLTAAANLNQKPLWSEQNGVYIQEMDLTKGEVIGTPIQLTHGHASNARWTEGPHIYKVNGRYLLMVAEGGTGLEHGITVFESDKVIGPYTPSHVNPVLTHRFLGKHYPIGMVGHGDLVETQNGEWWCVALGRRVKDNVSMLARETFLVPVVFEDGWPVFNPGEGKILENEKRPNLPWNPIGKVQERDEFNTDKLAPQYNFLRTPKSKWWQLDNGNLSLDLRPVKSTELGNPSMIVRRIQHLDYKATTQLTFESKKSNEEAGITVFLDNLQHYKLVKKDNKIQLIKIDLGQETVVAEVPFKAKKVIVSIEANDFDLVFKYGEKETDLKQNGTVQDAKVITARKFIGTGFNGVYVGLIASSNGQKSENKAVFDWFEYKSTEKK